MTKFATGLAALREHNAFGRAKQEDDLPTVVLTQGRAPAAPRSAASAGRQMWSQRNEVAAPSLNGPQLRIEGSLKAAVENLTGLLGWAYSARGAGGLMELAELAVRAAAADTKRRYPGRPDARYPLRGLEGMLNPDRDNQGIGALPASRGGYTATRPNRVVDRMRELPAYDGEGYVGEAVRGKDGSGFRRAADARAAISALDYFKALQPGFDWKLLESITAAKTREKNSLREPRLLMLKRTVPDLGAALFLAALGQEGFNDDEHETPRASLTHPNVRLHIWAEHCLLNLREVLGERNQRIRGEVYSLLIQDPDGEFYTPQSYARLVRELDLVETGSRAATAEAREAKQALFLQKKDYFLGLQAEERALQRKIEPIQTNAVAACDALVAYVRWHFDHKAWLETAQGKGKGGRPDGRQPAPPSDDFEYSEPRSQEHPGDNTSEANLAVPAFAPPLIPNAEAMLAAESPEAAAEAAAIGLTGWRRFRGPEYGNTQWKVVMGPVYWALDLPVYGEYSTDEELAAAIADWQSLPPGTEEDLKMLMIAPRREGTDAVDMRQARAVKATDFLLYFYASET